MMLQALVAALPLFGGPEVHWTAPGVFVSGQPYRVQVEITAPKDGAVVANWLLEASAFTVDGKPLAKRAEGGALNLPAGFKLAGEIDLAPYIGAKGDFKLDYAAEFDATDAVAVKWFEAAPTKLDFMTLPVAELAQYQVLLQTNRGVILVKLWPEIAPGHVRNFLDLSYAGFYDNTTFHRVMPGFMIQGGDPTATGTGEGPRQLKAEFSTAKKHLPGVLSMARGPSPDSASCQFFIMHGAAPNLDGQYSCFGETVLGLDVVDKIANAPGRPIPGVGGNKPNEPQKIEHAIVVKAPTK